jgi:hypothetical protein
MVSEAGCIDLAADDVIFRTVRVGGKKLLKNTYSDTNNVRTLCYNLGA